MNTPSKCECCERKRKRRKKEGEVSEGGQETGRSNVPSAKESQVNEKP